MAFLCTVSLFSEYSSSSVDSEDDFAENKLSCSSVSQNKPAESQKGIYLLYSFL